MAVTIRKRSGSQSLVANCQADDEVGDIVYVTGDAVSLIYQVSKVDYNDPSKMPGFGMIISKLDDTTCIVQLDGPVVDLYVGLISGRHCFVGDDGRLTQAVPTAPISGVRYSQPIAYAIASNTVLLGFNLPTIRTAN
jgi:hypothetical protein